MSHDPALPRHDWTRDEVEALFNLPFPELLLIPSDFAPCAQQT